MEEPERRKGERKKRVFGDNTLKHLEHLRKQARALSGEVNFEQEDLCLETTRVGLSSILRRHEQLKENLTREPGKSVHERLEQEFEAARMAQTQGEPCEIYYCVLESRSFLQKMHLPTQSKVLAWPLHYSKAIEGSRSWPSHLPYAEDALRTINLPQAYAEIGLDLQGTSRHIFPSSGALPVSFVGAD